MEVYVRYFNCWTERVGSVKNVSCVSNFVPKMSLVRKYKTLEMVDFPDLHTRNLEKYQFLHFAIVLFLQTQSKTVMERFTTPAPVLLKYCFNVKRESPSAVW